MVTWLTLSRSSCPRASSHRASSGRADSTSSMRRRRSSRRNRRARLRHSSRKCGQVRCALHPFLLGRGHAHLTLVILAGDARRRDQIPVDARDHQTDIPRVSRREAGVRRERPAQALGEGLLEGEPSERTHTPRRAKALTLRTCTRLTHSHRSTSSRSISTATA